LSFFIYILRSYLNKLYIGQTSNLQKRLNEHANKLSKSSKFIKDNPEDFKLVYFEKIETRLEAMRREKQLKGWARKKKEALILHDFILLKQL
jgi:predicted GIY-YIG superfamily endonuclease